VDFALLKAVTVEGLAAGADHHGIKLLTWEWFAALPHRVLRRVKRVAPVDSRAVLFVQQHVEPRQRARLTVRFLPEKLEVAIAHLLARPKEQRTRPANWIADTITRFSVSEFGDNFGDFARREKLALGRSGRGLSSPGTSKNGRAVPAIRFSCLTLIASGPSDSVIRPFSLSGGTPAASRPTKQGSPIQSQAAWRRPPLSSTSLDALALHSCYILDENLRYCC
jgi:hypothetical protein